MRTLCRIGLVLLLFAAVSGGIGWVYRTPLQTWWHVRQLEHGPEAGRAARIEALVRLGTATEPTALALLQRSQPHLNHAGGQILHGLTAEWPADDARREPLVRTLASRYPKLPYPGQQAVLSLLGSLVQAGHQSTRDAVRTLTRAALRSRSDETRLEAVRLALRPEVNLRDALVPLLADSQAEVRRAALLALANEPTLLPDDDLLRWLHDPDATVQRLCKTTLRSRGLTPADLHLGALVTSPEVRERLAVLDELADYDEVDPALWLTRLSHDPSPAVRAGAIRASGDFAVEFGDRLRILAQNDPDTTVRRLALFALAQPVNGVRPTAGP